MSNHEDTASKAEPFHLIATTASVEGAHVGHEAWSPNIETPETRNESASAENSTEVKAGRTRAACAAAPMSLRASRAATRASDVS